MCKFSKRFGLEKMISAKLIAIFNIGFGFQYRILVFETETETWFWSQTTGDGQEIYGLAQ